MNELHEFGTVVLVVALGFFAALGTYKLTERFPVPAPAPTDPAVMFSVLGNREIGGRTGTILEGESGANDPVGIALMIGMLDYATSSHGSVWTVVREFALEMSIGLAVGVAGAWVLL